ncbi:unnamed protein product [Amoebophrya sp. A25]|nr:unnamed protein product [Amoebophrya sp. A25]|eukprot:GSA25T00012678001.1
MIFEDKMSFPTRTRVFRSTFVGPLSGLRPVIFSILLEVFVHHVLATWTRQRHVCWTAFGAEHLDCARNVASRNTMVIASDTCVTAGTTGNGSSCTECTRPGVGLSDYGVARCSTDGVRCAFVLPSDKVFLTVAAGGSGLTWSCGKAAQVAQERLAQAENLAKRFYASVTAEGLLDASAATGTPGVTELYRPQKYPISQVHVHDLGEVGVCSTRTSSLYLLYDEYECTTSGSGEDSSTRTTEVPQLMKDPTNQAIALKHTTKTLAEAKAFCDGSSDCAGVLNIHNQNQDDASHFEYFLALPSDIKTSTYCRKQASPALDTEQKRSRIWKKAHTQCPWRLAYPSGYDSNNINAYTVAKTGETRPVTFDDFALRCGPKHGFRVCPPSSKRSFCDERIGICRSVDECRNEWTEIPTGLRKNDYQCSDVGHPYSGTALQDNDCHLVEGYPTSWSTTVDEKVHLPGTTKMTDWRSLEVEGHMLTYGRCEDTHIRTAEPAYRDLGEEPSVCTAAELPACSDACASAMNGICEDGEMAGPDGKALATMPPLAAWTGGAAFQLPLDNKAAQIINGMVNTTSTSISSKRTGLFSWTAGVEHGSTLSSLSSTTTYLGRSLASRPDVRTCPRGTDCTDCGVRQNAWRRLVHSHFFTGRSYTDDGTNTYGYLYRSGTPNPSLPPVLEGDYPSSGLVYSMRDLQTKVEKEFPSMNGRAVATGHRMVGQAMANALKSRQFGLNTRMRICEIAEVQNSTMSIWSNASRLAHFTSASRCVETMASHSLLKRLFRQNDFQGQRTSGISSRPLGIWNANNHYQGGVCGAACLFGSPDPKKRESPFQDTFQHSVRQAAWPVRDEEPSFQWRVSTRASAAVTPAAWLDDTDVSIDALKTFALDALGYENSKLEKHYNPNVAAANGPYTPRDGFYVSTNGKGVECFFSRLSDESATTAARDMASESTIPSLIGLTCRWGTTAADAKSKYFGIAIDIMCAASTTTTTTTTATTTTVGFAEPSGRAAAVAATSLPPGVVEKQVVKHESVTDIATTFLSTLTTAQKESARTAILIGISTAFCAPLVGTPQEVQNKLKIFSSVYNCQSSEGENGATTSVSIAWEGMLTLGSNRRTLMQGVNEHANGSDEEDASKDEDDQASSAPRRSLVQSGNAKATFTVQAVKSDSGSTDVVTGAKTLLSNSAATTLSATTVKTTVVQKMQQAFLVSAPSLSFFVSVPSVSISASIVSSATIQVTVAPTPAGGTGSGSSGSPPSNNLGARGTSTTSSSNSDDGDPSLTLIVALCVLGAVSLMIGIAILYFRRTRSGQGNLRQAGGLDSRDPRRALSPPRFRGTDASSMMSKDSAPDFDSVYWDGHGAGAPAVADTRKITIDKVEDDGKGGKEEHGQHDQQRASSFALGSESKMLDHTAAAAAREVSALVDTSSEGEDEDLGVGDEGVELKMGSYPSRTVDKEVSSMTKKTVAFDRNVVLEGRRSSSGTGGTLPSSPKKSKYLQVETKKSGDVSMIRRLTAAKDAAMKQLEQVNKKKSRLAVKPSGLLPGDGIWRKKSSAVERDGKKSKTRATKKFQDDLIALRKERDKLLKKSQVQVSGIEINQ